MTVSLSGWVVLRWTLTAEAGFGDAVQMYRQMSVWPCSGINLTLME